MFVKHVEKTAIKPLGSGEKTFFFFPVALLYDRHYSQGFYFLALEFETWGTNGIARVNLKNWY